MAANACGQALDGAVNAQSYLSFMKTDHGPPGAPAGVLAPLISDAARARPTILAGVDFSMYLAQVATVGASLFISAFLRGRQSYHPPPSPLAALAGGHIMISIAWRQLRSSVANCTRVKHCCVPWLQRLAVRTLPSLLAATGA